MPLKTKFYKVVFPKPHINPTILVSCAMTKGKYKKTYRHHDRSLKVDEGFVFKRLHQAIGSIPGDGTIPHIAQIWECEVDRTESQEWANGVNIDGSINFHEVVPTATGTRKAYGIKLTKIVWYELDDRSAKNVPRKERIKVRKNARYQCRS